MQTKIKKQTAGNNAFLKATRKLFNDPTYKRVMGIVNTEGEQAARAWLLKNVVRELNY
jgi:hypothetical protein